MSSTLTINTNLASLGTQRRLAQSTAALQQSFQRLSSGLRINKGSDDAAGLSIASSLEVDSRIYTQGVRNANDAVSLYAIAEGAVQSLVTITTRLKELAQQSSNGVLTFTQRKSLDAEAQALGKEYLRITRTTQFNGLELFQNSTGPLVVQAGYDRLTLSSGDGATGALATRQDYVPTTNVASIASADINNDGNADVLSAGGGILHVLLGNGDGTFSSMRQYEASTTLTLADVNGDGVIDAISAFGSGSHFGVLIGNGDGTFILARTYSSGLFPNAMAATDLNGDGIVDLISSDAGSDQLGVYLGNGDGSFKYRQASATGTTPRSVTAADVNGDGIADLISGDEASAQISVLIGNGNGTFKARQAYATGTSPFQVDAEDLNEDGIVDLVSADWGSSQLSVFLGNGDGTFRFAQTYATASGAYSVAIADYNGDGISDLMSGGGNTIGISFGNGNGTFQAQQTYATPTIMRASAAADLNNDGIFDVIAAGWFAGPVRRISVYLGNGSAQTAVAAPLGAYSLLSRQTSLDALTQFDKVLDRLTASLGQLGANESRLQTVTNVLQQTRVNYEAAASQIVDVDVATESANLAKGNILQQAGAAILAQANQQPALALRLLNGG